MRAVLTTIFAISLAGAGPALAQGDPEAGKVKAQTCVQCHGVDGNSAVPTFPRLNGQYASYIVQALADYKSGARKNAIMAGFAAALSDQDRHDLAAWFASQPDGLFTLQLTP